MTEFLFIRHGQADYSEINTKIYQGMGFHMVTLSLVGIEQIKNAALDERLKGSELIVSSPFGRAMHTSAILSKELQIDIKVETDIHEWLPNTDYIYLSDDEARKNYAELTRFNGVYPNGEVREWESVELMSKRVNAVLDKYLDYKKVIVVCHGTLMQYFLNIPHPDNGEIHQYFVG